MTIKEVEEILKGKFSEECDRIYFEEKLKELKQKEINIKENEKYYKKNYKYDR